MEMIPNFEAVIVRSRQINAPVIDAAKKMKFIGRAGVGVR
jgi:phosphoglycerate dehydrogenase-like enzyme